MSFARRTLVVVMVIAVLGIVREIVFAFGLGRFLDALTRPEPGIVIIALVLIADIALVALVARGNRWATLATIPVQFLLLAAALPVFVPMFGSPNEGNFAVWATLTVVVFATLLIGIPFAIVATLESFGRRAPARSDSDHGFSAASVFAVASASVIFGMAFLAVAVAASPSTGDASFEAPPDEFVSVVMSNVRFDPSELELVADKTTAVFVTNEDGFDHSVDVDALDIHVLIPSHQTKVVMIELGAGANLELYCAIPGHRDSGMVARVVAR
jgi:uncharacterized cupredoxin-like copper-binding protein